MRLLRSISTFLYLVCVTPCVHAENTNSIYKLNYSLPLSGAVRWDFLTYDGDRHHLFITRGDSVDVLDTQTHKIAGSIVATKGAHGVAIVSKLKRGFISNGQYNTITVFDVETFSVLATIAVGAKPDAIVYDDASDSILVANADSRSLSVIDPMTNKVQTTIDLKGKPEYITTDGKGRGFVNIEDLAQIVVIDTKKLVEISRYNLGPECEGPTGLSIDREQERLFVSCHNKTFLVVDARSGEKMAKLSIGASSDATIYDKGTKLAFSSNGIGSLSIVAETKPRHYEILDEMQTMPTARTMALDPSTHTLYLAAADMDGIDNPSKDNPHPRPHMKPESFKILVLTWDHKLKKN